MKAIINSLLLIAFAMAPLGCNLKDDKKDKKDNGDTEETEITACADLTKDGDAACTKADAITGKICVWEFDACSEQSDVLKNFRAQDMNFKANVRAGAAALATDEVLGTDHGERPDWDALCGLPAADRALEVVVASLTLKFKKEKKEVDVVLDCTRGGGANKTHTFSYDAKPTTEDALLIRLNNPATPLNGNFQMGAKAGNLLDFFSKADWLYSSKKSKVYGISQLKNFGYAYEKTKLDTEGEFDKAFTYARTTGGGYEVGKEQGKYVGAISFSLSKI